MPKRKQRTVEYYEAKIRKLQNKERRSRRISDSSSDVETNKEVGAYDGYTYNKITTVDPEPLTMEAELAPEPERAPDIVQTSAPPDLVQTSAPPPAEPSAETPQPELDPELLSALGDASEDIPVFGEKIHNSLSQRWIPILKKGLLKEAKTNLINEYPVPDNCRFLKAPTLNPEISAAIAEVVRNRDKSIQTKQDQLGHGIAAISKAISLLLIGDDKVKAFKILSDGCRLLTDLHFIETQLRTKLISPCLQKSVLSVIENQGRDETLFGVDLPEKIKSSKAIERQGHQIKKPVTTKVPTQTSSQSTTRTRYQENWQGPPRYPSANSGGRGGQHRPVMTQYRRTPTTTTLAPMATRAPPLNQNKQRAPRQ